MGDACGKKTLVSRGYARPFGIRPDIRRVRVVCRAARLVFVSHPAFYMRAMLAALRHSRGLRAPVAARYYTNYMKMFFGWCAGIALVAGGAYYFAYSGGSADGVQIAFKAPETIAYGAPFEFKIGIGNSSSAVWKNASLSLALPSGFVFMDGATGTGFMVKQLGDVGKGSFTEIPFKIMAVAEAEANVDGTALSIALLAVPFQTELSYAQDGSSTVFQKKEQWLPPVPSSAFKLAIEAPEKAASGEEIKLVIAYANKTGEDLDGLTVRIAYPNSFTFSSASTDPDRGNDIWNIGGLKNGSSDTLTVKGRFNGVGTGRFSVAVVRSSGLSNYPIAVAAVLVAIENALIGIAMDVNDTEDFVAHVGDTLAYTVSYTLDGMIAPKGGLDITADLLSPLFDASSIVLADGGIFRRGASGSPQIVWHVAKPDTEGGSVGFSVKVKPDYGIRRLGDRNFILKVHGEVVAGTTSAALDYETKLAGQTLVTAKGYFRDADSGMVNKGTLPPTVGTATQYTIHWRIINYATDVRGITVRASLPAGVTVTGSVKSNINTKPSYDASAKEVLWKIDRISATTGLFGIAPEAIFQVSSVPEASMKGKNAPLLGVTDLSATDDFTGKTITTTAPAVTTALPDDPTIVDQGLVQ